MCGIFGAVSRNGTSSNIAQVAYTALFQLQHRGHESAKIVVSDGEDFRSHGEMGTIDWVFRKRIPTRDLLEFIFSDKNRNLPFEVLLRAAEQWGQGEFDKDKRNMRRIQGREETRVCTPIGGMSGVAAIAHVRYSTTGESGSQNIHPIEFIFNGCPAAIAHNGNLVGLDVLKEIISGRGGYEFRGTTDTEVIVALLHTSSAPTIREAFLETLPLLNGAFSLVLLHKDTVYAANDRFAIRPLCVGETGEYHFVASESCALNGLRAKCLGEAEPGSFITLEPSGIKVERWTRDVQHRSCVFEHIYLARPDTCLRGQSVLFDREAMGRELAREHPIADADCVVPVLDSGLFVARGYAEELGKMVDWAGDFLKFVLIKGRVGRTFMDPIETERVLLQNLKHNGVPELIKDQRIVVCDDSSVRGHTGRAIVEKLRYFGARSVAMLYGCPPLRHPCHLGVDLPRREDYVAHGRTIEEIRVEIGADYVGYLSREGLYRALALPSDTFCDGCMSGEYPLLVT